MKKYNAGLDEQVVKLCEANASTSHGMTVGNGKDDSDDDDSQTQQSQVESDNEEEDDEITPPAKKLKKLETTKIKTPKKVY